MLPAARTLTNTLRDSNCLTRTGLFGPGGAQWITLTQVCVILRLRLAFEGKSPTARGKGIPNVQEFLTLASLLTK